MVRSLGVPSGRCCPKHVPRNPQEQAQSPIHLGKILRTLEQAIKARLDGLWATWCSGGCHWPQQGVGTRWCWRFLLTQTILCFYDTIKYCSDIDTHLFDDISALEVSAVISTQSEKTDSMKAGLWESWCRNQTHCTEKCHCCLAGSNQSCGVSGGISAFMGRPVFKKLKSRHSSSEFPRTFWAFWDGLHYANMTCWTFLGTAT